MAKTSASMGELIRRLKAMGVERITFDRGVSLDELRALIAKHSPEGATTLGEGLDALENLAVRSLGSFCN